MSKLLLYSLVAGFVVTGISATVFYNYVEDFNAFISGKSKTEVISDNNSEPKISSEEEINSALNEVDTQKSSIKENPSINLTEDTNKQLKNSSVKAKLMEGDIPHAGSY